VSQPKTKSFSSIVVASLGWPLFWGITATVVFYILLSAGFIRSQLVARYFAGHPVEYIETALFFIGVMALLLKAFDLAFQFQSIPETKLAEAHEDGDAPERSSELMLGLKHLPEQTLSTYLARRLMNALRYVKQSDSADDLDDQLRYLSDMDAERSHEGYSLVRIIVWATPMLGFLGTVIGITLALGQLSPEALVNAPKDAMQGLLAGLSVAFDTTALALSLSIVLMFLQYLVREVETQLLAVVDRQVEDELIGRFQINGSTSDPNVVALRRMNEQVLESVESMAKQQAESVESMTKRQADIWTSSISASKQQWSDALVNTNNAVQSEITTALRTAMVSHGEAIATAEQKTSERTLERWEKVQQAMMHQAAILGAQHESVKQQGEVMERVLAAVGEVTSLEKALNQNLNALAGSKNFEDTVVSLSAAIQLLSSRLGVSTPGVKLTSKATSQTAAAETGNSTDTPKGRAA